MTEMNSRNGTSAPPDKGTHSEGAEIRTGKASRPSATAQPTVSIAGPTTTGTASTRLGFDNRPSSSPSASRAPYVPQFSAATQMILKRMRGEAGGLASALASATASGGSRPTFSPATYESISKTITSNISSSTSLVTTPASSSSPSSTPATLTLPVSSTPKLARRSTVALASQKRKRGRDDDSDASSLAEASDYGEGIKKRTIKPSAFNTPTTTKSGRHILKPDTYDPAAEDNIKKRNQLGKRTTEQALCKKCTRMHSPATNQMVFCDGCNDPWHQRCHDPWIEDGVIKDPTLNWYCAVCTAKRERLQPKKKVVVPQQQPALVPWPNEGAREASHRVPVAL